jgi:hypothetical protein
MKVYERYLLTLRGQSIRGEGSAVEYQPIFYPQVLTEFAKLREDDDAALRRFSQRWGLFNPIPAERPDLHEPAPPVSKRLIWQHARNIALVLKLRQWLQAERRDGLADLLIGTAGPITSDRTELFYGVADRTERIEIDLSNQERAAQEIIAAILNDNLAATRDGITRWVRTGSLLVETRATELSSAIYYLVSRLHSRLDNCRLCHHIFVVTDERQKYCPPPSREYSKSVCGARARKRKSSELGTPLEEEGDSY